MGTWLRQAHNNAALTCLLACLQTCMASLEAMESGCPPACLHACLSVRVPVSVGGGVEGYCVSGTIKSKRGDDPGLDLAASELAYVLYLYTHAYLTGNRRKKLPAQLVWSLSETMAMGCQQGAITVQLEQKARELVLQ